jgi:hypothetical protein
MYQNINVYVHLSKAMEILISLEDLAKKAQKVLFSIKSRVASLGNIPIKVSNYLFDKLVQPVLTYNAEIS